MSNFILCRLNYYCWKYLYMILFFIILLIFLRDIPSNLSTFTTIDGLLIGSVFLAGIGYILHKNIESKYCNNKLYNSWKNLINHNEKSTREKNTQQWSNENDRLKNEYANELTL